MKTPHVPSAPLLIESLDQEGRGIARREGKAIFIEGALPGERVTASIHRRKPTFEVGRVATVLNAASSRTLPRCGHFGVCGGCALQHVDLATQVAVKQRVLEDALWHIGKVAADEMLSPIQGPAWAYRHRARFTVRYVPKKGGALVGFHEKASSFVADMRSCEVVPERISRLLVPLRELVDSLSIRQKLPQIELAVGEAADVLVVRVLEAPTPDDEALLVRFANDHHVSIYLQPGGPDTAKPLYPREPADLYYALPEFNVRVYFKPTDFTQVNHAVNRVLVRRALRLLAPRAGERIGDFFCGLGNFALPIARSGAEVIGIEGSKTLLERAHANGVRNGLDQRMRFEAMDIFKIDAERLAGLGPLDAMLIDPPRDGAVELVKAISGDAPSRIVYVSCNPATLARDAAVLVHTKGYALEAAGVVNMFPHTAHVESVALFRK